MGFNLQNLQLRIVCRSTFNSYCAKGNGIIQYIELTLIIAKAIINTTIVNAEQSTYRGGRNAV